MKTPKHVLSKALVVAALAATSTVRAAFVPIAINPSSFNHDVVVEASAPRALSDSVTATMDGGTNKNGNTFYERGYNQANLTSGLPPAGSILTSNSVSGGNNYAFLMPPDYHVNNGFLVGHNNGGRTPVIPPVTMIFGTPAKFSGVSFLTASGNGPVQFNYIIHYADSSTESSAFPITAFDWFNNTPARIYNSSGRVSVGGGVNSVGNATAAAALFTADVAVGNPTVNITSIDLIFAGAGANGNTNNNGRAVIFAVSGAKDGSADYTNTIPVTGFNQDVVVEADGPQTTGTAASQQAAAAILTNNITASMDGGTSKAGNVWVEKGYYAAFPQVGIPAAGSTFSSATLPASYTMPASYAGNCAVVLASNVTTANISLTTATSVGALSFLCGVANGDTYLPCLITHADGSSESSAIFVPDWFNRAAPWSHLVFGRINANNRGLANTVPEFVNPFAAPGLPGFDFRGLGLPAPRLFDAVVNVTNASPVTNITVNFTNGISTRCASIFAVSGAPAGNVPPVFGVTGSSTPGQPLNASIANGINLIKRWEGTNNIVLSVTNITGTGPLTYQWQKAPRGGGMRDILYSFDYTPFVNVVDGGRVSGSTTSALVISNALVADSADYLCIASNPYGSATSVVATVELLTTNISVLVGVPAGDTISPIASDSTPVAESLDHVIDRVAQKWLSDGLQFGGACCGGTPPFVGPVGFIVTPVSGASVVTSMRFFAANDTNGRDPSDYGLEGSNDGSTFTPITGGILRGTLALPTARNGTGSAALDALNNSVVEVDFPNATGYKSYRVSITNNMNTRADALLQIAEIELLGTFVPAPPVWVRQPGDPDVADVRIYAGGSPTFVAVASGLGSLTPRYQWYRNGTAITGATNSSYTLVNAQLSDSGATFNATANNASDPTIITSSSATLTVIAAPTDPYPAAVLANNPLSFWRLDETPDNGSGNNGTTAHDYRGGHNGYYSNAVIAVSGYNSSLDPNTAARFGDITSDSRVAQIQDVTFARPTNSAGATFTIEAWVYGAPQNVDGAIITKGYNGILAAGTGTGSEQFVLDVNGALPKKFRFLVRDAAGNGYVALSTTTTYDTNTLQNVWHHLAGVCNQPAGTISLYIDGLLAASGSIPTNGGILAQPLPVSIGARQSSGSSGFDNQFTGTIDDVAIYGTALSASQILNHYYGAHFAPVFTIQPANIVTNANAVATFTSSAYGSGTVTYQWYLSDGVNPTTPLGGQTSPNLTQTVTPAMNNNNYQVVATNPYGSTTSAVANLTVNSGLPGFYTDLPASSTVLLGHLIQLRVVPSGTEPFTYQWQKNGVNITDDYRTLGSQSNTLLIAYAKFTDTANYKVIVSNSSGPKDSTVDALTVTNATFAPGFTAAGTGWQMQGTTPPIMTANRLELTSNLGSTARAAFLTTPQIIGAFNASFTYTETVGANAGADGVTFCIQTAPAGAAAVGGGGGGLGYSGLAPSVAVAMNIYAPNTRGIGFPLQGGTLPAAGLGAYSPILPVGLGDNADPIQVNLSYANNVLSATFRDTTTGATFTTNTTVNIPAIVGAQTAYVGFTGADGGVASTQIIQNFVMPAIPTVTLNAQKVGNSLVLTWPASTGAFLRSTPSLAPPVTWTDVTAQYQLVGNTAQVTITPLSGTQFFRLDVYP